MPILEKQTFPRFDDKLIKVRRDQILVWVSIHLAGVLKPEKNIPKIPALLDTGFNFYFSIRDRHLREWAGIDPALLPLLGDIEINDQAVSRHVAAVWLHPNVPGKHDVAIERSPCPLEMKKEIAVYPPDAISPCPRLPLLGLTALLNNDLDFGSTSNCAMSPRKLAHRVVVSCGCCKGSGRTKIHEFMRTALFDWYISGTIMGDLNAT